MDLMIDWVTCSVPFYHTVPINGGVRTDTDENGEILFESGKWKKFQGSYESTIQIKTRSLNDGVCPGELIISGNPVKFFQGHNLFGSNDLTSLIYEVVNTLSLSLEIPQPVALLDAILRGAFDISRIDINGMYDFGTQDNAFSFLHDVQACARTRSGTAISKGETIYLNKTSKRWSLKLYNKLEEISARKNKQHQIELPVYLQEWLIGKVRIELTLKSNELREKNLHQARVWDTLEVAEVFEKYIERIDMKEQIANDDILLSLSPTLTATYLMWKDGHPIKTLYTKPKFYRHRTALLEHGIDILIPQPAKPKLAKVIPIQKVIEGRPATIPDWVYGTDLFFEPRKSLVNGI